MKIKYLLALLGLLLALGSCVTKQRRLYMVVEGEDGRKVSSYSVYEPSEKRTKHFHFDSIANQWYVYVADKKTKIDLLLNDRAHGSGFNKYLSKAVEVSRDEDSLRVVLPMRPERIVDLHFEGVSDVHIGDDLLPGWSRIGDLAIYYDFEGKHYIVANVSTDEVEKLTFDSREVTINKGKCKLLEPLIVEIHPHDTAVVAKISQSECGKAIADDLESLLNGSARQIRGVVMNVSETSKSPLAEARVELIDLSGFTRRKFRADTDVDGNFTIAIGKTFNRLMISYLGSPSVIVEVNPEDTCLEVEMRGYSLILD